MIKGKKAWLRIVEAVIAIILIASVLTFLYLRTVDKSTSSEEIYKLQKSILDEIADDPELRNAVLNLDESKIKDFTDTRKPYGFNSTVRICEIEDICGLQSYEKEVYSTERVISANLQQYSPKKVKIFMWRE